MQSIGERLEEARKRRGITIREAAESTNIRGDYLNSFENNDFDINIPEIYVRGFLRSYANHLKVNSDKIVTDYNAYLIGEGKAHKRDSREFLGRLELHDPIIRDETKTSSEDKAATHEEANSTSNLTNLTSKSTGNSFWENLDKEVLIKAGIATAVGLALIIALIWFFISFMSSSETPTDDDSDILQPAVENPADSGVTSNTGTQVTILAVTHSRFRVSKTDGDVELYYGLLTEGETATVYSDEQIRFELNEGSEIRLNIGDGGFQRVPEGNLDFKITPSKIVAGRN